MKTVSVVYQLLAKHLTHASPIRFSLPQFYPIPVSVGTQILEPASPIGTFGTELVSTLFGSPEARIKLVAHPLYEH